MVRDSLGTILLSFPPIFVIISRAVLSSFGKSRLQYFGRWWMWVLATMVLEVPSASLISSYIKGMSTSVRFRSIIVDCGLGCPTRVSGVFLQSWARADSVVFVHHDSALSIASLMDCGILPVRCVACFISCCILYVLMLCLVLFYLLCERCVFKVFERFFHCCYVIMFVHVRPLAEDLTLIL